MSDKPNSRFKAMERNMKGLHDIQASFTEIYDENNEMEKELGALAALLAELNTTVKDLQNAKGKSDIALLKTQAEAQAAQRELKDIKKHQHDIEQLQQKNKEQMEEIKATRDKLRLVEQERDVEKENFRKQEEDRKKEKEMAPCHKIFYSTEQPLALPASATIFSIKNVTMSQEHFSLERLSKLEMFAEGYRYPRIGKQELFFGASIPRPDKAIITKSRFNGAFMNAHGLSAKKDKFFSLDMVFPFAENTKTDFEVELDNMVNQTIKLFPDEWHPRNSLDRLYPAIKDPSLPGITTYRYWIRLGAGSSAFNFAPGLLTTCNYLIWSEDPTNPITWIVVKLEWFSLLMNAVTEIYGSNTSNVNGNFFITLQEMKEKGVPYEMLHQHVGDTVVLQEGCIFMTSAECNATSVSWSISRNKLTSNYVNMGNMFYLKRLERKKRIHIPWLQAIANIYALPKQYKVDPSVYKSAISHLGSPAIAARLEAAIELAIPLVKGDTRLPVWEKIPPVCNKCSQDCFMLLFVAQDGCFECEQCTQPPHKSIYWLMPEDCANIVFDLHLANKKDKENNKD